MSKVMINLVLLFVAFSSISSFAATRTPISFGIDCMVHDNQGKMLLDLGAVGAMRNGSYMSVADFEYGDLKIEANLSGPFTEAPEVASPQIRLTVFDSKGNIAASVVTTANPNLNAALLVPSENIYLHCDEM
jgi:hypothetical protein